MKIDKSKKITLIINIVRVVLSIALIILDRFWLTEANFGLGLNLFIALLAWIIVAYDVVIEVFVKLFKERDFFNEDTLMLLASIGAFCLRAFGEEHNEFFEAVLVMILYQVGEAFESFAEEKSKKTITDAIDLRKELARVETENGVISKTPEQLSIGDIVIVGKGEKVPCDGYIVEGRGAIDESSLTGEALPKEKEIGDEVFSMSLLKEGMIKIKVDKEYEDSTAARMLKLVIESSKGKSKTTRFIDKFAKVYTPVVFLVALIVAVVPPLFLGIGDGNTWASWIYAALCFLIISCPCAVVISVPLAYFSGLGLASKSGIIVKGAAYFDKLNTLQRVVFDKTGTLTTGKFSISKIVPVGVDENKFMELLCAAESCSTHPLAICILEGRENLANQVKDYEEISGYGVKATYLGNQLIAGNLDLLSNNGIKLEQAHDTGVCIYLSNNGKYIGHVVLKDEIKPNSKRTILGLKKLGVSTVILSGDLQNNVDEIKNELDTDYADGNLLPQDKLSRLKEYIEETKGSVAFMGDGINDAPSIVLADIGIAMGGLGSDVAVENADVVFMNDDPSLLLTTLSITKSTKHRVIFNIAFSLTVKFIILVLTMISAFMGTWELPIWVAIFADTGLAILMIISSTLLFFSKPKIDTKQVYK